jgi:type IV pilus assembly protein PilY1
LRCDAAPRARRTLPLRRGLMGALAAALALGAPAALSATTDLSPVPLPTYTVGSTVDIKPNIFMVLDDSGSMIWDYLPDWAGTKPDNYDSRPPFLVRNASFNGLAYNPAVTYLPPLAFKSDGTKDTTSYPSMDGTSTLTGADSSSKPNWRAVPNDGFGVQNTYSSQYYNDRNWTIVFPIDGISQSTSNLVGSAYYYVTEPGTYCNSPALTNCQDRSSPNGTYAYPAPLRWCDSSSLTNCRALEDGTYKYPRMPAPRVATINFSSAGNAVVSGITVNGKQIMSGGTSSSNNSSTVASRVASAINDCTNAKSGNCTTVGYIASIDSGNSNTVRIFGPTSFSGSPSVSKSGVTTAITSFDNQKIPLQEYKSGSQSSAVVPGENLRTTITSYVTQYAKPATRTDCAAASYCTYNEEMTNYANWWAYYRTRMQMMKTSTSRAFAALDTDADIAAGTSRYRVGYMTLNNNTDSDFVNIKTFDAGQKVTWFSKLFAAEPQNGTPLRAALATAGQLYAGKLSKVNKVNVEDPLQYSCQKNYTILSTDGYWNGGSGSKLDGSTAVGNQDGGLPRPYNDGGSSESQTRTNKLKVTVGRLETRTGTYQRSGRWGGWSWNYSIWQPVGPNGSCTAASSSWSRTECRLNNATPPSNATSSCTRTFFDNGTSTADASGNAKDCGYEGWSSWTSIGSASCVAVGQSAGPAYSVLEARECQIKSTGGTSDTLADVAAYYYNTDLRDSAATSPDATGTCTGPTISPSTTPNDLCENNVPSYGRDNNPKQHMTTHTLGLGAQGKMVYSPYQNDLSGNRSYVPDYWNQPSGDFYSVANGSLASPSTGVCPWMSNGTACTWPAPSSDSIANIDDLWHAAVNGHGTYFSAKDPSSLASALSSVLNQIVNTPRPGTAAAAASSNPNITSSDNYVFSSSYRSVDWFGELIMQRFNPDGTLTAQQWSAMRLLDCATTPWQANHAYSAGQAYSQGGACYVVNSDYTSGASFDGSGAGGDGQATSVIDGTPVTRTVYTVGSSGLVPFAWDNLTSAQQDYFKAPHIDYVSSSEGLTQFCTVGASCLTAAAQTAAQGQPLVDYLRGDRTNEGTYFRSRQHVLGDIVSSEARYVKAPLLNYTDPGYDGFKTAKASRAATVYVGSNDGMLHAFDADTGQERWAFIPSAVLPSLYQLADSDYANKHRYFVDGTPEVGDICPSAPGSDCTADDWRTIIVGGLNQGGKSFYALDITDPASPHLLWEFTNAQLGYTYSNPRITKLHDGTWAVIVASGYNNADGVGRLFVLNASTGALITTISTGVGSAASPAGLAKLSARAPNSSVNNTVEEVYGGDLLGNVWRFDVNDMIGAPGTDAQLLVQLQDADGNPQPITAKPTVASVGSSPMVMVGTGRYLGLSDLPDTRTYTMYGIKDKLDSTTLPTPRSAGSNFVQQIMVDGQCPAGAPASICSPGQVVRTSATNPVDWGVKNGWYVDFILGGERSVTDPTLALGTLVFTTIKPQSSTTGTILGCTGNDTAVNAKSYLYYLDYLTGGPVDGTGNVAGEELCTCIATRPSVVKTQGGSVEGIIRMSGGGTSEGTDMGVSNRQELPVNPEGGVARRISWRVLNGN